VAPRGRRRGCEGGADRAGTLLDDGGRLIEVRGDIKPGHKVAAARWRRALPSAATKFAPWIIGPVMWPAGHVAAG
jgi:hypothetical protein